MPFSESYVSNSDRTTCQFPKHASSDDSTTPSLHDGTETKSRVWPGHTHTHTHTYFQSPKIKQKYGRCELTEAETPQSRKEQSTACKLRPTSQEYPFMFSYPRSESHHGHSCFDLLDLHQDKLADHGLLILVCLSTDNPLCPFPSNSSPSFLPFPS